MEDAVRLDPERDVLLCWVRPIELDHAGTRMQDYGRRWNVRDGGSGRPKDLRGRGPTKIRMDALNAKRKSTRSGKRWRSDTGDGGTQSKDAGGDEDKGIKDRKGQVKVIKPQGRSGPTSWYTVLALLPTEYP